MSPSRPFILRPVATSLLMAAILLAGMVAFTQLPVSALPQVDYPTIQVVTFYPGASPHVMATTVTAPLERQFGQIQGLIQMTSTSSGGCSVIVLQFNLNLNIDVAEQEVQSAINAAQSFCPQPAGAAGLQQGEPGRRAGAHAGGHLRFHAAAAGAGPGGYETLAQTVATQRRWPGQHQRRAEARGAHPSQSRRRLSSYGLNLEDLRTALPNQCERSQRNFDGPHQNYQINANDQLLTSTDTIPSSSPIATTHPSC